MAATEVVKCREKFKIKAPAMEGPAEFMRAVRAQYVDRARSNYKHAHMFFKTMNVNKKSIHQFPH